MKKIIGIYKITSPSGRVYIGQSWNMKTRWYAHGYKSATRKLCASFKKYGKGEHKFEVIHELPHDVTQELLDKYEQLYIDSYRECGISLLNIREAGSVGKMPIESRLKMSKSRMGRVVTEETRKKISDAHKGKKKPKTKEHIEKVRKALKGRSRDPKLVKSLAEKRKGQKRTLEQRKRMSDSHKGQIAWNKGKKMSAEYCKIAGKAMLGKKLSKESIEKREATKRLNKYGFTNKNQIPLFS